MGKVVIKNKHGKIIIIHKFSYPETFNEYVYKMIVSGELKGLLPIEVEKKGKKTYMECRVERLRTLEQHFGQKASKKEFLDFVRQIITIIKNCEEKVSSSNNLDLRKDTIFIDPFDKSVKCIFWPIVNARQNEPAYLFLKQLPYNITFDSQEDSSYLERYASFFQRNIPFSINDFERLILKLQGKEEREEVRMPSEEMRPNLGKYIKLQSDLKLRKGIQYDPLSSKSEILQKGQSVEPIPEKYIYCSNCGNKNNSNANFCSSCGKNLMHSVAIESKDSSKTKRSMGLLNNLTKGTMLLEPEKKVEKLPFLHRISTDEKIVVDKPLFQIGREKCDLLISDNVFIGRQHADIVTRGNQYFIVDRNSANKTFVNDKMILDGVETELYDGTSFQLANEKFVFHIE